MPTFNATGTSAHTLNNSNGMTVTILTYGAIIQSINVPDRDGKLTNVVLGFNCFEDYREKNPYFGAVVGRYANRIAGGTFVLDGTRYNVPINNSPNSLHGGTNGFDRQHWTARDADNTSVTLEHVSPDGDEGYPGTLEVSIRYTLTDADQLRLEYTATSDAPTVINLSNHTYFNLAGEGSGSILDHVAQINASHYTPVDATLIPTGEIVPVSGTPFDFTKPTPFGRHIRDGSHPQIRIARGIDHNYVLDDWNAESPASRVAAIVTEPTTGRVLTVTTGQPGVQCYTGNFLDGTLTGTSERVYRQGDAFCLETQHFPDSPNHANFPSTELAPGQTFRSSTGFAFSDTSGF